MEHETLDLIWPIIAGGLVVPIVGWVKAKLPADFPLQSTVISAAISIFAMWGLSQILAPDMTWQQIVQYALGTQVIAQFVHAGVKTKNKLVAGGTK